MEDPKAIEIFETAVAEIARKKNYVVKICRHKQIVLLTNDRGFAEALAPCKRYSLL